MERVPKARQAWALTRVSVSESSQRTVWPLRRQAPEKPEFGSILAPRSGATRPVEARQITALSSASAMATPLAPVMEQARSATSCSTSSRANSSSLVNLADSGWLDLNRRRLDCSWMQAKASSACRALRPVSREGSDEVGRVGAAETVFGGAGARPHAVPELFGVALIVSVKPAMAADSLPSRKLTPIPWLARTILLCCTLQGSRRNRNNSLWNPRYLSVEVLRRVLRFYARRLPGLLKWGAGCALPIGGVV